MHVPVEPRFQPGWLQLRTPALPEWLDDDRFVPQGDYRLHARARTGLHTALARREFGSDATALLPSFVSCAVADACRAAGLSVAHYPVSADLSLPVERVSRRIEAVEPEFVVFNHYFGFADSAFERLAQVASEAGATVVEDCARGLFSRRPDGQLLGSTGDIAIYSLRKLLPVPNGGLVVADDLGSDGYPSGRVNEARAAVESAVVSATRAIDPPVDVWAMIGESAELVRRARATPPTERDWSGARPGRLTRIGLARIDPQEVAAARRRRYRRLRRGLVDVDGLTVLTPPAHEGSSPYGVAVRFHGGQRVRDFAFAKLRWQGTAAQILQWPPDATDIETHSGSFDLRSSSLLISTHQQVPMRALGPAVDVIADSAARFAPFDSA